MRRAVLRPVKSDSFNNVRCPPSPLNNTQQLHVTQAALDLELPLVPIVRACLRPRLEHLDRIIDYDTRLIEVASLLFPSPRPIF